MTTMQPMASGIHELIRLNVSGEFKSGARQRGFMCRVPDPRAPGGHKTKRLKGLTKLTKRLFRRRQPGNELNAAGRLFVLPSGTVPLLNTRRVGTNIHRHVMHSTICKPTNNCRCKAVCGIGTGRLEAQQVSVRACVSSAHTFVRDYNLEPVIGEPIIYLQALGLATRADALFRPRGTSKGAGGPIVLVSWKSGAGPRSNAEYMQHCAQVKFERDALINTHGVNVTAAYIVYLTAARDMSSKEVKAFYHAHKAE